MLTEPRSPTTSPKDRRERPGIRTLPSLPSLTFARAPARYGAAVVESDGAGVVGVGVVLAGGAGNPGVVAAPALSRPKP